MRCGLFGKLPAKRDFVAIYAPRPWLDAWEPWMQAGISASQQAMRDGWRDAFLTTPIWRFWLGAEICGMTVMGAFMPSLDGVGRYYPLTVFACGDASGSIPPPELDAQDEWFASCEEFLLSTLHNDVSFETVTTSLDRLVPPKPAASALADDMTKIADGCVGTLAVGRPFTELFGTLRAVNDVSVYAAATFWWTLGGDTYAPFALSCRGMPSPFLFAHMLTGRFAPATV